VPDGAWPLGALAYALLPGASMTRRRAAIALAIIVLAVSQIACGNMSPDSRSIEDVRQFIQTNR